MKYADLVFMSSKCNVKCLFCCQAQFSGYQFSVNVKLGLLNFYITWSQRMLYSIFAILFDMYAQINCDLTDVCFLFSIVNNDKFYA